MKKTAQIIEERNKQLIKEIREAINRYSADIGIEPRVVVTYGTRGNSIDVYVDIRTNKSL